MKFKDDVIFESLNPKQAAEFTKGDPARIKYMREVKANKKNMNDHIVDTLNKYEDGPDIKQQVINYSPKKIKEATPEQFGQLAEKLERNRQMSGAAPTKTKDLKARFNKPKLFEKIIDDLGKPKPFIKVKKTIPVVYPEIPKLDLERIKPITKTPKEIEAEIRFQQMVRQDKERKLREQNSGLAGLMGGVKL